MIETNQVENSRNLRPEINRDRDKRGRGKKKKRKKFPASFTSKFRTHLKKKMGRGDFIGGVYSLCRACTVNRRGGRGESVAERCSFNWRKATLPLSEPLSRYRSGPGKKAFNVYLPNNSSSYRGRVTRRRLPVCTRSPTNVCARASAIVNPINSPFLRPPSPVVIVAAMLFQTPEK